MLAALLAATQAAPPGPPPAPPIVSMDGSSVPWLIDWRAGVPRCAGDAPLVVREEPPMPTAHLRWGSASAEPGAAAIRLRFRIDAEGRPLGISSSPGSAAPDVVPAFSAWRFAPGAAREECEILFEPKAAPVAEAELETVYRFLALVPPSQPGFNRTVGKAAFLRAHPTGSTCSENRPAPRMLAYPALERVAQAPGTVSHTFFSFDIGAGGEPTNVQLLNSGGNVGLDREAADAIRRSRFAPGERRGCIIFFSKTADDPLLPPSPPEEDALAPAGATCPTDSRAPWVDLPRLVFPDEFRRRNIEGWAVIRYDLAPWGAVGNVEVAAAQPAAIFGERAAAIVRGGRKHASASGYSGCMTRVIFKLPPGGRSSSPDP